MTISKITDAHKKKSIEDWTVSIESALVSLLNSWRVWVATDELRALHIGFGTTNVELSISLLTNREPYLDEGGIKALSEPWPTADWRLTDIASEHAGFQDFLTWLSRQQNLHSDASKFDEKLGDLLFGIATSRVVLEQVSRFRNVHIPLPIRIESFESGQVADYLLPETLVQARAPAEDRSVLTKYLIDALKLEQKKRYKEAIHLLQSYLNTTPHEELARIAISQIEKMVAKQNDSLS